jgi:hypothetical protein
VAEEEGYIAPVSVGDYASEVSPVGRYVSDVSLDEPPGEEQAIAAAQGLVGGAIESGGMFAGAVIGGKAGAAAAPFLGPLAPAAPIVGAIGGGITGLLVGGEARELASEVEIEGIPITTPSVQDMSPELRPYGYGGEVFGGGLPFAGAPVVAAKMGFRAGETLGGGWINKIINTAGKAPKSFIAAETSALISASAASGVTEFYSPDSPMLRIGSEIVAGAINPTRHAVTAGKYAASLGRRIYTNLSPSGAETEAAKWLKGVVVASGEDPVLLAKLAREYEVPGLRRTIAQKTGSPALAAIEKKLSEYSAKFGNESRQMADDSLDAIRATIKQLHGTGDPRALEAAAQLRATYFKTLLAGRLQAAENEALEAAGKIAKDSPEARSSLSKIAMGAVDEVLTEARAAESELWGKISKDVPTGIDNLIATHAAARADMLQEVSMPPVVEAFIKRMTKSAKKGDAIPVNELVLFRKEALSLAREASHVQKLNDARIYGELAEAALDDMNLAYTAVGGEARMAYDEARVFSRELNDVFTRTFVGKAGAKGKYGPRVPPELALRKAMASGKEAGALQLQELEEATRFLVNRGKGDFQAYEAMLNAQERVIRLAAADAIDPKTGLVNPTTLSKFVRNNEELLNRFPAARDQLQKAVSSEIIRQDVARSVSGSSRIIDQKAAFAKIVGLESPDTAIGSMLLGKTPAKDLRRTISLAKKGGPEAVEGLKASVYDLAVRKASSSTGGLDLAQFKEVLFQPVSPGNPSLIEMMQKGGVLGDIDVKLTKRLLDEADKIKAAAKPGTAVEEVGGVTDFLQDLLIRISGSFAAGKVAPTGEAGHGLIVHAAGSRFAQNIFNKMPVTRVRDVLIEGMKNPEFGALLMTKPKSPAQKFELGAQIHAYLFSALGAGAADVAAPEMIPETEGQ